jgi:CheY-like chemotaxis protein
MGTADVPPTSPVLPSGPDPAPKRPVSILLVEDNKDIARVLSNLLSRAGYRVVKASGVAQAIQEASTSGPIDLLISDLSLPDGSGLELMHRLGPIPGIAVSGYSTEIDLKECLDAGFIDLLAKPVTFSDLEKTIRRIVG